MGPNPSACTVAAVLLLLGAKLVIDPGSLDKLGETFIVGLRNFHHEVRGLRWRERPQPNLLGSSKMSGRLWGTAFIAAGLLIAAVS